jgi:microcystin-dependent protein
MARNGSGSYTRVNTFVAGNSITAAGHNQNWADLETEMSNSVAADGQTTITAALKGFAGTVSTPGYGFSADTNTGIYRIGADNLGIACAGAKVIDVATTGADVIGALSQNSTLVCPAGIVVPYAGGTAPTGWLLCYGQSLLRASYARLFTAIGTAYGAADGDHFNVPDLRGRVPAGKDNMGGSAASRLTSTTMTADGETLGAVGGTQTHTLTEDELPEVTPAGTNSAITPTVSGNQMIAAFSGSVASLVDIDAPDLAFYPTSQMGAADAKTATFTGTPFGGDDPHLNVQPTIILNYIIST